MLFASLHILSAPMTMQVNPFPPSRMVFMLPSSITRTTFAPSATAFGAAEWAFFVYSASLISLFSGLAKTTKDNNKLDRTRVFTVVRVLPPETQISLAILEGAAQESYTSLLDRANVFEEGHGEVSRK